MQPMEDSDDDLPLAVIGCMVIPCPPQMITQVVAHVHLLHLSILVLALNEDILKEVVIVLLHLFISDIGEMASIGSFGRVLRVDVEVLEQNCLRERRLVVDPRASLPVGAGTRLEEEGAVDFVLLRTENARQVLSHLAGSLDAFSCRSESSNKS